MLNGPLADLGESPSRSPDNTMDAIISVETIIRSLLLLISLLSSPIDPYTYTHTNKIIAKKK